MSKAQQDAQARLDAAWQAREDRLTDAYSKALDGAVRAGASVTSNPLYRTGAEDRRVARAEAKLDATRTALHRVMDVGSVAFVQHLTGGERAALLRYVEGPRTSAQFDALTPPVAYAVGAYEAKEKARAAEKASRSTNPDGRPPVYGGRFTGDRIA